MRTVTQEVTQFHGVAMEGAMQFAAP